MTENETSAPETGTMPQSMVSIHQTSATSTGRKNIKASWQNHFSLHPQMIWISGYVVNMPLWRGGLQSGMPPWSYPNLFFCLCTGYVGNATEMKHPRTIRDMGIWRGGSGLGKWDCPRLGPPAWKVRSYMGNHPRYRA